MDANDLRKLLEETNNKLSVFSRPNLFDEYELNIQNLYDLIGEFLSDEEKLQLFDIPNFKVLKTWVKVGIINLISDEKVKLEILNNDGIVSELQTYEIMEFIKGLSDNAKKQVLYNKKFCEKSKFSDYEWKEIILSMSDEVKTEVLSDKTLMTDTLHMSNWNITEIIKTLSDEDEKSKLIEQYNIESALVIDIASSFSLKKRMDIILNDEKLNKFNIIRLMRTFDSDKLIDFMIKNRDFLDKKKICPYEVIAEIDSEKQKEIALKLKDINLPLNEKMEILAIISEEAKQNIDTQELPEELRKAISMKSRKYMTQIVVEFDRDMEDYRGLDRLIKVNPTNFTEEEKAKFRKLCEVCPTMEIINLLNNTVPFSSTTQEYMEAEEWIDSIIGGIDPTYSKAQKMAIIDNAIGKKISYSPDFDTEVFNSQDARALWKIVSTGYGVCNGIATLEQYMLRRVGIESDVVGSGNHAFLKIKDIELPLANGNMVKGNTIVDPTWNLTTHRYGGKPSHFCISYEQARQRDVDDEGKDHQSHKNDEKLQDATISLDDQSLRNLYTSVGLADEKGQFPIKDLIEKSKLIDEIYASEPSKNIEAQFLLLAKTCPEFATCQNSSMRILKDVLLSNENIQFNRCVVNRVYTRTDKGKKPVMYVFIDSDEIGKKFYFASKEQGRFIGLSQEEFTKQFECYETDLEKNKRNKTMGN